MDVKSSWKSTSVTLLLVLATWGLTLLGRQNPKGVERLYSSKVYPFIAKGLGKVTGMVSFSIGEVLVFLLLIAILAGLVFLFIKPGLMMGKFPVVFHWLLRILGGAYILFYFVWGFNYFREDYTVLAAMSTELATLEELEDLTLQVIKEANRIRPGLTEDEEGVFVIEEDFAALGEIAQLGFENYLVGGQDLSGDYGLPKPLMISKWMSYTGITGIYFPYTAEANVNIDIPHTNIPATICHEIGHQRGFAKEEEANFIAYRASTNNPDPRFQYSGYYLALQYLLGDLYKQDQGLYYNVILEISDEVRRDMNHGRSYWKMREGKAEKVATTMNDNYLKANNQGAGVKSYNGVVKLLLAEYKSR